jgi:hypothetical protein
MSKTKITITIERDFPLTDEEISIAMNDIQAKLQGFYEKTPDCLKKVKMSIGYDKKYNMLP